MNDFKEEITESDRILHKNENQIDPNGEEIKGLQDEILNETNEMKWDIDGKKRNRMGNK